MTAKEMYDLKASGATFQYIADICGVSKQAVQQKIVRYVNHSILGKRGKHTDIDEIVYKGVYEYFVEHAEETFSSFARKIAGDDGGALIARIRNLITGKYDTHLSIPQIKLICEIVGKPFEEVFEERDKMKGETS